MWNRRVALILAMTMSSITASAHAQGLGAAGSQRMFGASHPNAASAALRLTIPFGPVASTDAAMLTFTAGPEWRDWNGAPFAQTNTHATPMIVAGISLKGTPVLRLIGLDLLDSDGRLNAAAGETGSGRPLLWVGLGLAAVAGAVALALGGAGNGPNLDMGFGGGVCPEGQVLRDVSGTLECVPSQ